MSAKTYSSTYLYRQYNEYERRIFTFLMESTEIDKGIPEFEDIAYDVRKRQINSSLVSILNNKNVILLIGNKPLDKAFKVFCAKDIKGPNRNKKKVFIDCSGIITKSESGRYVCDSKNIDILISYLVSAMILYVYEIEDTRFTADSGICKSGAECFSSLVTYIVDYLCKITTIPGARNKCVYLACLYYFSNIMGLDFDSDTCSRVARKVSGISEREAYIVNIDLKNESFSNIKFFIETVADVLRLNKLTLDVFIEKWMYLYGTGTVFGTEIFPAFATMITDAYVGAYINNQKTIEKVVGTSMNEFTKKILDICSNAV